MNLTSTIFPRFGGNQNSNYIEIQILPLITHLLNILLGLLYFIQHSFNLHQNG
jgi:hypothetical protein